MTDLIVDKLVFKDIQLTATNDDQYFVFEDILYQVCPSIFRTMSRISLTVLCARSCSVFHVI